MLNRILYSIKEKTRIQELIDSTKLSRSTISSYLRLSTELGLTKIRPICLTELGKEYVKNSDKEKPIEFISESQTETLKNHITHKPFSRPAIYGIYSAVETIFALSKNYYPVPLEEASKFFSLPIGKQNEWAAKAANDAFTMYSNYGID